MLSVFYSIFDVVVDLLILALIWGALLSIYENVAWKKLKAAKLAQDPLCEKCKERGIETSTDIVHNTNERRWGKVPKLNELESLCLSCHSAEHDL